MKDFTNKLVLITGGASGIGKIMTRIFLEQGARVIIWDINQAGIDQTILELSVIGKIYGYKVDVSNVEQVNNNALQVKSDLGIVDILINNAGIVVGKYFHEHTNKQIDATMAINSSAPFHITLAFLNDMIEQNSGHICNIASSGGLIANPKMSVYAASKWALIGWSDSLRLEMEQLGKNINITTIMPYYINTGMFDGVKSKLPILEPEDAAKSIINAIKRNKMMVTIPNYIYRFTRLSQGLLPTTVFDFVTGKVLGIYKTMEHFTGRK